MKLRNDVTMTLVWIGLLLCGLPAKAMLEGGQQSGIPPAESNWTANSTTRKEAASQSELPDNPSESRCAWQDAQNQPGSPDMQSTPIVSKAPQSQDSMPPPPQQPVGTAAAGSSKASGITAAQPAGIAIAPAKQRRIRTIVLRFGAIVGAGVAVGTVVALSRATPSKPPGAQ